ncbi:hypothetical protein [Jatrophihabitans lederbergiae]|uniref:Uncharacterized protein n=1 Tax=Jatrophihabitans lederbergiae TaxID=3075547 RepID=A0ABU2JAE7_9ACTN|nr:hypothetical protein [Jatrophihabitans sp. DSM 44399]MDT0261955.1 hypothetical protein [Jatrophihabitans sp. DSM 44399]
MITPEPRTLPGLTEQPDLTEQAGPAEQPSTEEARSGRVFVGEGH